MPFGYAERFISRHGKPATLYTQTVTFNATTGARSSTTSGSGTPFFYSPVVVDEKVKRIIQGWSKKVDRVIWVDPSFDVSTEDTSDTNIVEIEGNKYLVEYVTSETLVNHGFKLVGLVTTTTGAL